MVALERPARDAQVGGEGMQLVVALVADQVRPQAIAEGPDRWIDEDCHRSSVGTHEQVLRVWTRAAPGGRVLIALGDSTVTFGEERAMSRIEFPSMDSDLAQQEAVRAATVACQMDCT